MRGYGGLCGSAQRSDMSLFFFSSRRRHTRWPRDWSSDVCSSDLPGPKDREAQRRLGWGVGSDPDVPQHLAEFACPAPAVLAEELLQLGRGGVGSVARSEEHTSELQ